MDRRTFEGIKKLKSMGIPLESYRPIYYDSCQHFYDKRVPAAVGKKTFSFQRVVRFLFSGMVLQKIIDYKRQELDHVQRKVSLKDVRAAAGDAEPARDFLGALIRGSGGRSPSGGS